MGFGEDPEWASVANRRRGQTEKFIFHLRRNNNTLSVKMQETAGASPKRLLDILVSFTSRPFGEFRLPGLTCSHWRWCRATWNAYAVVLSTLTLENMVRYKFKCGDLHPQVTQLMQAQRAPFRSCADEGILILHCDEERDACNFRKRLGTPIRFTLISIKLKPRVGMSLCNPSSYLVVLPRCLTLSSWAPRLLSTPSQATLTGIFGALASCFAPSLPSTIITRPSTSNISALAHAKWFIFVTLAPLPEMATLASTFDAVRYCCSHEIRSQVTEGIRDLKNAPYQIALYYVTFKIEIKLLFSEDFPCSIKESHRKM